ncbi:MAG: hypothetical protein CO133_02300, partial [Candidatus Komeilibacteria bacterium CG_4_9_14_3_um_filter_37_5]
MIEAILKQIKNGGYQCTLCHHNCFLKNGQTGLCRTRKMINNQLMVLNYNQIVALQVDPIEKKPLYHFLPGSQTLSLACWGCNFKCLNCQNFNLSQEEESVTDQAIDVNEVINRAKQLGCLSIAYTYTEPTIFL